MNFLYAVLIDPFVQMAGAPDLLAQTLWEGLVAGVLYALIALGIIIAPLVDGISLPYASPANYTGTLQALQASMSLVATFVMGSPVVFALCRLFLDRTRAVP